MMLASVLLSQLLDYLLHFYYAFTMGAAIPCPLGAFSMITTHVISIGPFPMPSFWIYCYCLCLSRLVRYTWPEAELQLEHTYDHGTNKIFCLLDLLLQSRLLQTVLQRWVQMIMISIAQSFGDAHSGPWRRSEETEIRTVTQVLYFPCTTRRVF
jgi:hypothetical protein